MGEYNKKELYALVFWKLKLCTYVYGLTVCVCIRKEYTRIFTSLDKIPSLCYPDLQSSYSIEYTATENSKTGWL